MGTIKKLKIKGLKLKTNEKGMDKISPIMIPVHLAQTGNWYPNKKKLLSGIWWHPQYLEHHSINFIHTSSERVIP